MLPADWKLIELYDWVELRVALRCPPALLVVDTSFDPGPFGRACLRRVPTLWLEPAKELPTDLAGWERELEAARARFAAEVDASPRFSSGPSGSLLGAGSLWPHLSHELSRANRDRKHLALLLATVEATSHPEAMARAVGQAWMDATRSTDLGIWLGGASFAFVVAGHGREEDAAVVARRFLSALDRGASMRARVGLAASPIDGVRAEDLYYAAEDAWRIAGSAKEKSTLGIGNEHLRERVELALSLQDSLRAAMDSGELRLRLSPVRALDGGRLRALEVSPWWPGLAEAELSLETALELAIEGVDGVFQRCLELLAEDRWWPEDCELILYPGRRLLRRRNLAEQIRSRAGEEGLRVALGLTRRSCPGEPELLDLSRAGVSFVFSDMEELALGELLRWPLRRLKLPPGLTHRAVEECADPALEGLVELTRRLELSLVVTGEHSDEERAQLQAFGCHEWQGPLQTVEAMRAELQL